jgi:hypothetical protein
MVAQGLRRNPHRDLYQFKKDPTLFDGLDSGWYK